MINLADDAVLARRIADGAGAILLSMQQSQLFEGKALGKAGDRVANAFIVEALAHRRSADSVLSEEEASDPSRLSAKRVWIVDPLDGTREYAEGRSDWAVHVALAIDGHAVVGAVALPGLGETLCSAHCPSPDAHDGPLRMLVSRTRPAAEALAVAEALGAVLVPMGSAGAKAMAVVRGDHSDDRQLDRGFHQLGHCRGDCGELIPIPFVEHPLRASRHGLEAEILRRHRQDRVAVRRVDGVEIAPNGPFVIVEGHFISPVVFIRIEIDALTRR